MAGHSEIGLAANVDSGPDYNERAGFTVCPPYSRQPPKL